MRPYEALLLLLPFTSCGLFGDTGSKAATAAREKLAKGDLGGGLSGFNAAFDTNPESVDAAVGASYAALLAGDTARSDQILASIAEKNEKRAPEIHLRRAIVAMRAGDLDKVRSEGEASGTAAGRLFAAEVALADGERDAAAKLLDQARSGTDPAVTATVEGYLSLLKDADPLVQGLSEADALWALGKRSMAARAVEEILKSLSDENPRKSELLLTWSGRAAAVGEAQVASNLVEAIAFPPPGQLWRVIATRGIVACAEADPGKCKSILDGLEGQAPPAGLSDARATAALLLAPTDPARALEIVASDTSAATSRARLAAGDKEGAIRSAPQDGMFAKFLSY
jgi:hypothetical protein